jgi:hypothetical protein
LDAVITADPVATKVTCPVASTVATAVLSLEYVMAPVPAPPEAALVNGASPKVLAIGPALAKEIVCADGDGGGGGGVDLLDPPPPPPQPASSSNRGTLRRKQSPQINDMAIFPVMDALDGDLGRLVRLAAD